jgi:hypothetical protein
VINNTQCFCHHRQWCSCTAEDHRDVKAVRSDITALLAAGILDRTADGAIEFPYEAVRVEFLLQAA